MVCLSLLGTSMLPSHIAQLQLQSLAEGIFTTRKEVALHVAAAFGQGLRYRLSINVVMHYSSSTDLFYVAGMRTTRSQAQEETYSSSSEEEAEGASGSGNSEPSDSSSASSVAKANVQVCTAYDRIGRGVCRDVVHLFLLSELQCECPGRIQVRLQNRPLTIY